LPAEANPELAEGAKAGCRVKYSSKKRVEGVEGLKFSTFQQLVVI